MNRPLASSSPTETLVLPSAYSFGGFVQVRTSASVIATDLQHSNQSGAAAASAAIPATTEVGHAAKR